jgi:hypothetical protein
VASAWPLIPAGWRTALGLLVATLDDVTTSFKAGKDLFLSPSQEGAAS